jgi:ribosome-binding protein aMBF1 (putative translation factor)
MELYSSRSVNKSSVHALAIEKCWFADFNRGVPQTLKSIAIRLKSTREAIGVTAAELCRQINCKPNRWSQYESGDRKITVEVADRLCDEYGLTLDWIYRANPAGLPHRIHIKLRQIA